MINYLQCPICFQLQEFMGQDKLDLVFKLKELKDPQCVEMLAQFMQYLMQNQQSSTGGGGGTIKRGAKNSSKKSTKSLQPWITQRNHSDKASVSVEF